MNRLQAMQAFVRVVESNSFTRASDTLNIPRTSVTNLIQALESYLNVRLLERTTRRLHLTEDGRIYYERCVKVLAEIEEIEGALSSLPNLSGSSAMGGQPRGRLRVDTSGPIGKMIIVPALDDFHARYPDIDLIVGMSDRRIELIEEGIDCAICLGEQIDTRMVTRKLSDVHFLTVATPAYIDRYGMPKSLEDLQRHVGVKYISPRTLRLTELRFMVDGEQAEIDIPTIVTVSDAEAHLIVGLMGLGLFQIARVLAQPYLDSGALIEVLPEWKPAPVQHSIVYPQSRPLSPALAVFVEWMLGLCVAHPLLAGPG